MLSLVFPQRRSALLATAHPGSVASNGIIIPAPLTAFYVGAKACSACRPTPESKSSIPMKHLRVIVESRRQFQGLQLQKLQC